ncbi:MAG TPA: lysylphosphatidylglycerol synthase domain-containing protein, partial [Steroidobacteraceae bacterium]|nr:lysylphosphatidylglycerol synthase domain-containing protein [Steroidobacteraceae bacterium]
MDGTDTNKRFDSQSIKRWAMALVSLVIFGVVIYVVHHLLAEYRWRDVLQHMRDIPAANVGGAALITALSYLLLTGFDALGIKYTGRHVPYRRTALISFMAYAFGHNVGVAAFSGAALRYRLYSAMGLGVVDVATIVGFCSLTTALGLSVVGGSSLLFKPRILSTASNLHADLVRGLGVVALIIAVLYIGWALFARSKFTIRDWTLKPPGPRIALPQLLLGVADILVASATLWILLPEGARPSLLGFSGAYAAAVLGGLISTVPAGLGVFESIMLLLLPNIPGDQLLGCLLVYRAIYYWAPLALATVLFVIAELWQQRAFIGRVNALASVYVKPIAPQLAGVLIFLSGAVLLVS